MSETQTIFRVHKSQSFTPIRNETIRDDRLSFRATGLLVYLLSLPTDWEIHLKHICSVKKSRKCEKGEGRDAVMAALKELRACGYVEKKLRRERGRIVATEWNVYECPHRLTGKPEDGFTEFGKSAPTKERGRDNRKNEQTTEDASASCDSFSHVKEVKKGRRNPSDTEEGNEWKRDEQIESILADYPSEYINRSRITPLVVSAIRQIGFEQLLGAVRSYKARTAERDSQYIARPENWFRSRRWEEELRLAEVQAAAKLPTSVTSGRRASARKQSVSASVEWERQQ